MAELITQPTFRWIEKDEFGEVQVDIQVVYHGKEGEVLQLIEENGQEIWLNTENLSKFVKEINKHLKEIKK